jgi:hypothetical protein
MLCTDTGISHQQITTSEVNLAVLEIKDHFQEAQVNQYRARLKNHQ